MSLASCLDYLRDADINPYAVRPGGWPQSFGQNYGVEALKLKAAAAADTGRVVLQRTPTSQTIPKTPRPSATGSSVDADLFSFNKTSGDPQATVLGGTKKPKIVRRSDYGGSPSTSKVSRAEEMGNMFRASLGYKIPKRKPNEVFASPGTSKNSDKEDVVEKVEEVDVEKEESEECENSSEVSKVGNRKSRKGTKTELM